MPRIGITGHMNLTPPTAALVSQALREALSAWPAQELVGVSCLAAGADSLFAEQILAAGGRLQVLLPAADYRERKVKPDHAATFDRLVARATDVRVLPYPESNRDAYEAANQEMLASCDLLLAVWDGQPAGGRGGTADVVELAQARGLPATVIWPDGARRT